MRVEEDAILEFVSAEFSERVELAYTTLEIEKLSMENVCVVFQNQELARLQVKRLKWAVKYII